ncbi:MAG: hypothetical protein CL908_06225 [Deltaproteobacteria bacterium]|nr:hypothetical protein [Deltaproteobacteria bacterium]
MRIHSHPAFLLTLTLACVLPLPAQTPTSDAEIGTAAKVLGVSAQHLTDPEIQVFHFPTLDLTVTGVKARDRATGEILSAVQDAAGNPYDLSQLRAQEAAARRQSPTAKLHPNLKSALDRPDAGTARLPIILWLEFDSAVIDTFSRQVMLGAADLPPESPELANMERQVADFAMARAREITLPFAGFLRTEGFQVRYTSTTAPVIFTNATRSQILSLAAHPNVDTIYLEQARAQDHNSDSNATHRTDRVHEYGVKGRGVRVAVLENNGVDPANPWLNVTAWFNAGTPNPDNHVQGTAGCIASSHATRPGAAPDVALYSANAASYSDADITAAADWIVTQNIDATNMSYGGNYAGVEQYKDRYFDYQSRNYQDSYIASAGNDGLGSSVGSPGTSWNCVTAGGLDNQSTNDWDDDTMYNISAGNGSSTADPNNGCEKPNLVGSAVDVDTLGNSAGGWITNGYNGTSFAAPFVTANLANAMVVDSSAKTSPEAASALMMATAWHNIEGASRLSEQDGAGGLHGLAAYRCAAANRVRYVTLNSGSFSNNGYYTYDITLQGGDRTRVCIAWSSKADSGYTTTTLDADLDLAIFSGSGTTSSAGGTYYGGSSSFNNNMEIVEFTPPTTGTYTVRINDYRFDGTSERVGIAFSQKWTDTHYARLREYTSENSSLAGPTIGNLGYYMDYDAPGSPSAPYLCYPSGTQMNGFAVSAHTWFPCDRDVWTDIWFDHVVTNNWFWFGYSGNLNANGAALSNRMTIPNVPWLVGYEVFHVGLTGGPTAPDGFKEVSQVHAFTIWPLGTNRAISDDGTFELALPFNFKFYGVSYSSVWVNANGNLTFGAGDTDLSESVSQLLANEPRIAACWDDLEPDEDGSEGTPTVRTREISVLDDQVIIEFIDVGEYQSGPTANGANTFRYILRSDNTITVEYRDCDLEDCIAGISPGNGLSSASEVDLTSNGNRVSSGAIFEHFTGGADAFDLPHATYYWNRLRFAPTSSSATTYRLLVDVE